MMREAAPTSHRSVPSPARQELRAMVALAIPVVIVQVGLMAMGTVDTVMVGHVSARVLAAVALGNLYFTNVSVLGLGTLLALDPLVAQAVGAGDEPGVARAMQRGMVIALGVSILTGLLLLPGRWVFVALHQQPEVVGDAGAYLRISILGVLPFFTFVVLRQSLQAVGRLAPIVWIIVGANGLNVALNWVLVYGHLGFPAMEARGSAIATCAARWAMGLGLLVAAWGDLKPRLLPVHPDSVAWRPIWAMIRLGAPIGMQQMLELGAFGAIGLLMGVLGTRQIAAHQIAITLAALTFMVPLGVGAAASVRVGHAIGAGDAARARDAARAAYLCGVGFMCVTALLFLTRPSQLAALFTADPGVLAIASVLIPIAGVFQIFDGAQAVGAGVLRGIGDTKAPLVAMVTGYWLFGLPVSAYLGFHTALGPRGLWWGFVVSLGIVALALLLRVRAPFRRELEAAGDRALTTCVCSPSMVGIGTLDLWRLPDPGPSCSPSRGSHSSLWTIPKSDDNSRPSRDV